MIDNQTKQAITDAMKLLSDSDPAIRIQAIKKLGTLGVAHPQIIERLQSVALSDISADVRNEANACLKELQPPLSEKPLALSNEEQSGLSRANEKTIIELLHKQNETLENLRVLFFNSTEARSSKEYQLRARIVDIDISISSMVSLMLKWVIASIPAAIIIGILFFFFSAILGGCFAALG